MKDDKIPKTIKGVERTNFCQMIVKSTATNFAMMINMKNRGANFKFTPEHVTNLTWTGFFAGGYDKNDLIKLYDGLPNKMTLEKFWEKESLQYATELIEHAGFNKGDNQE